MKINYRPPSTCRTGTSERRLNDDHGDVEPIINAEAESTNPLNSKLKHGLEIGKTVDQVPCASTAALNGDKRDLCDEEEHGVDQVMDAFSKINIHEQVRSPIEHRHQDRTHLPQPHEEVRNEKTKMPQWCEEVQNAKARVKGIGGCHPREDIGRDGHEKRVDRVSQLQDTGFEITEVLHYILQQNPDWNGLGSIYE
jgi:hypothetical protein